MFGHRYREPCLCGAPDCRSCFPQNFRDGVYKYKVCPRCEVEWVPPEDMEPPYYCDECAVAMELELEQEELEEEALERIVAAKENEK